MGESEKVFMVRECVTLSAKAPQWWFRMAVVCGCGSGRVDDGAALAVAVSSEL